jgi:hypothetical protein
LCATDDQAPGTVFEALRMMDAALDALNGPAGSELPLAVHGEVLEAFCGLGAKWTAARAAFLARFDAGRGHDADGYGSSASWLAAKGRITRKSANIEVRGMRQQQRHPIVAAALARGEISDSWAAEIAEWTGKLPPDWRADVDKLLVDTAAAGANLEDLAIVARCAYERWRSQQPDPDEPDAFDDRYLKLGTTIGNAGRVNGNLAPECTAALQAVLETLGKKAGPEDTRTEAQRYHDALQLACELLIRAKMVPDRAGADTHVDAVASLAELLQLPGASVVQEAWLAAMAGEHGYLAGKDAEAAACDAIVSPVVTGHPDLSVVDKMIGIVFAYLDATGNSADPEPGTAGPADVGTAAASAGGDARRPVDERSRLVSPEAWRALRYAMARLAIELVSGPGGLASALRRNLLDAPYNGKSVILDVGYADTVPPSIRRAVQLRARHCEWPGCRKRPVNCDVHHLRHKKDGGPTSVTDCVLLCQFHHDVCIHRWGWRLVLHPDGATTAYGPKGQVLYSHGPPGQGPPDTRAA